MSYRPLAPISIVGAVQASRAVPEGGRRMDPNRLLSVVYSSDGMAKFNASIWALIEDKELKYALTTFEKGQTFFLKKILAVDGLNQGHSRGRAPATFAEQRTNLGKRLIEICLLGGTPVLFLDGQHASPGSGKYKQHCGARGERRERLLRRGLQQVRPQVTRQVRDRRPEVAAAAGDRPPAARV